MATKILNLKHRVAGVLTDVTSAALADPTAAFGVRAVAGGGVVVASGTAMNHDGTGRYSYPVTGLTAGAAYEGYVTYVYGGETRRVQRLFTVPAPVAGATTTLAAARLKVRSSARSAGEGGGGYTEAQVDDALQLVCARFCRLTRAVRLGTGLALSAGSAALPALPAGFRPEQLLAARLNDADESDVVVGDYGNLRASRRRNGSRGTPRLMAFAGEAAGEVWPTPSAALTLTLDWWQTFQNGSLWRSGCRGAYAGGTAYAIGDVVSVAGGGGSYTLYRSIAAPNVGHTPSTSATYWQGLGGWGDAQDPEAIVLNVPDDWLAEILPYGPPAVLQHPEPEQQFTGPAFATYLEFEKTFMGAGGRGARLVTWDGER